MRWDRICLRIMLWSLGMTAAVGAAAIFSAGHETLVRLLGTTATTAFAAALLWPLTKMAERPGTRVAGLVGMGAVLVEFALVLVLIWGEMLLRNLPIIHHGETLAWTALFLSLTAPPAVAFLVFLHHPAGWLVARVGTGASLLVFMELMASTFVERSRYYMPGGDWLGAAAVTALFGILVVACLAGTLWERPWRWAGVASGLVAWLIASISIFHSSGSESGKMLFTLLTSVAVVIAYANLCFLPNLAAGHEIFRLATIGLGLLTALLVDGILLGQIRHTPVPDGLTRLAAAAGVITACGTLALLILALLNKKFHPGKAAMVIPWVEIALTCPACDRQQKVPLGDSLCGQCRLPFSIRIGERR